MYIIIMKQIGKGCAPSKVAVNNDNFENFHPVQHSKPKPPPSNNKLKANEVNNQKKLETYRKTILARYPNDFRMQMALMNDYYANNGVIDEIDNNSNNAVNGELDNGEGLKSSSNKWIEHVRQYAKSHGITYFQALKVAKSTYKK